MDKVAIAIEKALFNYFLYLKADTLTALYLHQSSLSWKKQISYITFDRLSFKVGSTIHTLEDVKFEFEMYGPKSFTYARPLHDAVVTITLSNSEFKFRKIYDYETYKSTYLDVYMYHIQDFQTFNEFSTLSYNESVKKLVSRNKLILDLVPDKPVQVKVTLMQRFANKLHGFLRSILGQNYTFIVENTFLLLSLIISLAMAWFGDYIFP